VGWKTSGDFLSGFIGTHNVGRFLNPMEGHNGPIFYYLVVILIGFFPWSVFMGPMLHALGGRIRNHHRWYYSDLFVVCWAVVVIGVFSLAATKLPSYVLPAYPAMALIAAAFLDRLSIGEYMLGRRWMQASYAWLIVVGVGLIVGCAIAAKMFLPGEWMIATIGLVPLTGGMACLWLLRKNQLNRSLAVFAASAVVLATGMFGFCAVRIDQYQVSQPLMNLVLDKGIKGARIGSYGGFEPSWGFYAHKPIAELSEGGQLLDYLSTKGESYVITNDEALEELEVSLPPEIYILARAPRFLKKGELLILGRPHEAAHWPEVTRISTPSQSIPAATYMADREGNVDQDSQEKPK